MTAKFTFLGAIEWYRTDSYWNSASTQFCSTMGTGVILSASLHTDVDNYIVTTDTTYGGRTFVFAYGDGSGVQMNHLSLQTATPSDNNSKPTTTSTLVTAPTSYTNARPGRFSDNLCISSFVNLEGTADTSGLTDTITAWSDGYKATTVLELDWLLPGALGGWAGVCIVYYSSQYVQDATTGAVCHSASVSSGAGAGPSDFNENSLMHLTTTNWQPPAMSAAVTPTSSQISGGKYELTFTPTAATVGLYTEGFYASAKWYQPKYASSYDGIARYGKDDYVGVYCMQGAAATTYFRAPDTGSVKLAGAVSLAAGILALGSALSLAM